MPKKGFPYCECGWSLWRLVRNDAARAIIECVNCRRRRWTRSARRWDMDRERKAAAK